MYISYALHRGFLVPVPICSMFFSFSPLLDAVLSNSPASTDLPRTLSVSGSRTTAPLTFRYKSGSSSQPQWIVQSFAALDS